ncbi:hypothetical protein PO909_008857, partial [Leuciscus waleckii]
NVGESALPGARFQLEAARDSDSGSNSVHHYKLSHNDNFRLEVKDRGEDGKIPILILQKPLDREVIRNINLQLIAVDGGKPAKSGTMAITINVLDINDNFPVFTKEVYSVMLSENAPIGTTVIQVNATDLDEGPNGEIVYSFGKSVNSKVRKLFDINNITGEITVKGLLDYEDKDSYEIDIQASDKGSIPTITDKSVTIKIVDVNDNAQDSRPGTTVALISVFDLDSGLNGKVSCSLDDDHSTYSLVSTSPFDRETTFQYDITIVAKDAGQPSLSSVKTITVLISDVNDNSPGFAFSPYAFYVIENNVPGKLLFSVSASDKDSNENAVVSYHIWRENTEENKYTSFININSENGEIYALKSFDFETVKTFQFQVIATDSGSPSLSSNVTVNVFILGHLVTKVRAYDADIGYNGWLLFSLQEVSDHSPFSLDRYTGQIRTLRSFTETDEAQHKLLILVKDNGNVSLSATATVIVKVVEPKEAFAASDVKHAVKDEEENDVTFYLIITLGSVSVLFVISIIVLIVMQCSKSTDYSSKYLQDTNYDGTLCHSIQYRSGDKRYMLVGPRMSIGSTIAPGSNRNTLVIPDRRRRDSGEVRK